MSELTPRAITNRDLEINTDELGIAMAEVQGDWKEHGLRMDQDYTSGQLMAAGANDIINARIGGALGCMELSQVIKVLNQVTIEIL